MLEDLRYALVSGLLALMFLISAQPPRTPPSQQAQLAFPFMYESRP